MDGNGIVHLKTDSKYLYSYTKALAMQNDLEILADTEDLYGERDDVGKELSIKTFYESHYLKMGMPINYMAFRIGDVPLKSPQWDGSALAAEHVRIKF